MRFFFKKCFVRLRLSDMYKPINSTTAAKTFCSTNGKAKSLYLFSFFSLAFFLDADQRWFVAPILISDRGVHPAHGLFHDGSLCASLLHDEVRETSFWQPLSYLITLLTVCPIWYFTDVRNARIFILNSLRLDQIKLWILDSSLTVVIGLEFWFMGDQQ